MDRQTGSSVMSLMTVTEWCLPPFQGVSRALAENSRTLRLPSHLHERLSSIRNAKIRLEERGITPSVDVSISVFASLSYYIILLFHCSWQWAFINNFAAIFRIFLVNLSNSLYFLLHFLFILRKESSPKYFKIADNGENHFQKSITKLSVLILAMTQSAVVGIMSPQRYGETYPNQNWFFWHVHIHVNTTCVSIHVQVQYVYILKLLFTSRIFIR